MIIWKTGNKGLCCLVPRRTGRQLLPEYPRALFLVHCVLIYSNDIVVDINSYIRLFADDTTLYIIVDTPAQAALTLNQDLVKISSWADKWLVSLNPKKI